MAALQGDIAVGQSSVKSLVNRLSKDFSAAKPSFVVDRKVPPKYLYLVQAVFSYQALQEDELSLEVGDIVEDEIIKVTDEVEDGWSSGRQRRTGHSGMFPTNFVEAKGAEDAPQMSTDDKQPEAIKRTPSVHASGSPTSPIGKDDHNKMKEMARVKFVYDPQHSDELRLDEIGVLVNILRKDCRDAGWFEGELNGRRGLMPDNFVELVQVPTSTASGTLYASVKQPSGRPAKVPLATPGTVAPPAVPAKPAKLGEVTKPKPEPIMSNSPAIRPSFAALRSNIEKGLPMKNPDQMNKSTSALHSGVEHVVAGRPVSTVEPRISEDSNAALTHITKNRARPPTKRPTSMMMLKKKPSVENIPASDADASGVESASVTAASFTATPSPAPNVSSGSISMLSVNSSLKKMPMNLSKDDLRDKETRNGRTSISSASSPADTVVLTRLEYNDLLHRLKSLEDRVLLLEKK